MTIALTVGGRQHRRPPAGQGASTALTPVTLLYDLFTDANGTLLPNHAMTVGAGWTAFTDTDLQIQGNTAQSPTAYGFATADAGAANVTVAAQHKAMSNGDPNALIVRFADETNYWSVFFFIYWNAQGTAALRITKMEAGTETTEAETILPFSGVQEAAYAIKAVLNGNAIAATINDLALTSVSSAFNNTATKHGLAIYSATDRFDNFQVTAP